MHLAITRLVRLGLLVVWLLPVGFAAEAQAQTGCGAPVAPTIGVAVGRSSPYVDLAQGVVTFSPPGSVIVNGGAQFAGRADLSLAGPLRLRIEGATARWDVRHKTYDPDGLTETTDTSVGHMSARHLVALVGLRTGRAPACAHVSAGGGLHAIGFQNESVRRPGATLSAGIELPTGAHGAFQADVVLHLIATRSQYPIASSTVPALNLLVGWAYLF